MDWLRNISTLELTVWSIAVGAILAIFSTYYNRTILGGFVRTLINNGALSVDTAITLDEVGYQKNAFIKRALVKKATFRKIVFEVDDEIVIASEGHSFSARTKPIDLSTARFYIAEENRIMAELRYDNKGADIFGVITAIIIILVLAYVITLVFPYLVAAF